VEGDCCEGFLQRGDKSDEDELEPVGERFNSLAEAFGASAIGSLDIVECVGELMFCGCSGHGRSTCGVNYVGERMVYEEDEVDVRLKR
jgi:hypothetical protein